jgi:spore coat protein CotH
LNARIDVTQFMNHVGVQSFLGQGDGILGSWGINNFYLYRFANTTTFLFLPWDKSNAFFDVNFSIFRNIVDGPEDGRSLLAVRALQESDLLQLYLDTMLECGNFALQGAAPDQPGWLEAEINREYDQIHAAALEDTFIFTNADFEQAIVDLQNFARTRSAIVAAQVAAARR